MLGVTGGMYLDKTETPLRMEGLQSPRRRLKKGVLPESTDGRGSIGDPDEDLDRRLLEDEAPQRTVFRPHKPRAVFELFCRCACQEQAETRL